MNYMMKIHCISRLAMAAAAIAIGCAPMVAGAYTTTETVVVTKAETVAKSLTFNAGQSLYQTGYENLIEGTVVVALGEGFTDIGGGVLKYNGNATGISGTIDYATGAITLTVLNALSRKWNGCKFVMSGTRKYTTTEANNVEMEAPIAYLDDSTIQVGLPQIIAVKSLTFQAGRSTYVTGYNNFVPGTVVVSLGEGFIDLGNGILRYNGSGSISGTVIYATGTVILSVNSGLQARSWDGIPFQVTGAYVMYKTIDPTAPLAYFDGTTMEREEVHSQVLFSVSAYGTSNVIIGLSGIVPGSVSISLGNGLVDSGTGLLKMSETGAVCGYIDYVNGTITWNLPTALAEEWKNTIYTISGQRTITTYTVVPKKGSPYKISFKANGGKGKMAKVSAKYGENVKLPACKFSRDGYVFAGWALKKGSGAFLADKATVKNLTGNGGSVTLYAVWAKKDYKVKFYANGGKGKMTVQKFTYGKSAKLKANKFKRKGYTFKGWATSKANAKNGVVKYKNKAKVKNLNAKGKTVKLYAVWKEK